MSEYDKVDDLEPDESPDEEEYVGDPGATSPDTGTHYDGTGEPEITPHDLEELDEDEE